MIQEFENEGVLFRFYFNGQLYFCTLPVDFEAEKVYDNKGLDSRDCLILTEKFALVPYDEENSKLYDEVELFIDENILHNSSKYEEKNALIELINNINKSITA